LILDSIFFSGNALKHILENFVEPKLAEALGTITNEGWEPSLNSVLAIENSKSAKSFKQGLTLASMLGEIALAEYDCLLT